MILAIDPSVNNVGIAIYDLESKKLQLSCFHPKRLNIQYTLAQIALEIRKKIPEDKWITTLIVEYPNFQGSTKGIIAAQKGYTLDLACIAGFLMGNLGLQPFDVHFPTPLQWKKNLPKEAIARRFQRYWNLDASKYTDHEHEAAMMIAWYLT